VGETLCLVLFEPCGAGRGGGRLRCRVQSAVARCHKAPPTDGETGRGGDKRGGGLDRIREGDQTRCSGCRSCRPPHSS